MVGWMDGWLERLHVYMFKEEVVSGNTSLGLSEAVADTVEIEVAVE